MGTDMQNNVLLFNEEGTIELIFETYHTRLLVFAKRFVSTKYEAEDIIQEVFIKLWLNRECIKKGSIKSYLFTLVRNSCINHIKHQKVIFNHKEMIQSQVLNRCLHYSESDTNPLHLTIYNEMQKEICTILMRMPKKTQHIFFLSRFNQLKNIEIAEDLNVSIRTVQKHLHKACNFLKIHLSH